MRNSLIALLFLAGFCSTVNADTKICPLYAYGNFGGVTYYYAARCEGTAVTGYVSWAGPGGLSSTPCGTGCVSTILKTSKKADKPNKFSDADESVREVGASNYNAPSWIDPSGKFVIKPVEIDGRTVSDFYVKVKNNGPGWTRLMVRVYKVVPNDVSQTAILVATAWELLDAPEATDVEVDSLKFVDRHLWQFDSPIGDSGISIETQVIIYKY